MTTSQYAKVMLVDDETEFLDALSQRLEIRGMKVTGVTSGEEAVQVAEKEDFDAIILDLSMPKMDGLETLKQIKEHHPEAEIIMLTGHGTIKSSVEALKLGAEDFMEKPVEIKDLLQKIEQAKEKRILVLQKESKKHVEAIIHSKSW